jgi:hypothetical protein
LRREAPRARARARAHSGVPQPIPALPIACRGARWAARARARGSCEARMRLALLGR